MPWSCRLCSITVYNCQVMYWWQESYLKITFLVIVNANEDKVHTAK